LKISGTFNSETIASKRALAITATFWSAAVILAVGLGIQSVREISCRITRRHRTPSSEPQQISGNLAPSFPENNDKGQYFRKRRNLRMQCPGAIY
jgi:hypothetical protein